MNFLYYVQRIITVTAVLPFFSTATSLTPEQQSANITLSDNGCSCVSLSDKIFNCRQFLVWYKNSAVFHNTSGKKDTVSLKRTHERIKNFLDSTGYLWATSNIPSIRSVAIRPGNRAVIRSEEISLRGSTGFDVSTITPPENYPRLFNAEAITNRIMEITRTALQQGFPFAALTTDLVPTGSADSVILRFYLETDSLYCFAAPRFLGNGATRRTILLYDIAMATDSLFSINAVERTVSQLASRNYISSVHAEPPVVFTTSDTTPTHTPLVTVPLQITERSGMGLDGALGLESAETEFPQLFGTLEFSFLNLFHHGEEAALSYAGEESRQQMDAHFSYPWLLGMPLEGTCGGGLEIERDQYGFLYGNLRLLYETGLRWHAGLQFNAQTITDSGTASGQFSGIDLLFTREAEPLQDGQFCRYLSIATGSGFAKKEQRTIRSHFDFGLGIHLPCFRHQAFLLRGFSGHIISHDQEMIPSEKYRVGGSSSLRGYTENEFAFSTTFYGQLDYLYYFQKEAAAYLLFDGGIGFINRLAADRSPVTMAGFGAGVRIPAAGGILSIEWARNYSDRQSLGRVHVRLQNAISSIVKNNAASGRISYQ